MIFHHLVKNSHLTHFDIEPPISCSQKFGLMCMPCSQLPSLLFLPKHSHFPRKSFFTFKQTTCGLHPSKECCSWIRKSVNNFISSLVTLVSQGCIRLDFHGGSTSSELLSEEGQHWHHFYHRNINWSIVYKYILNIAHLCGNDNLGWLGVCWVFVLSFCSSLNRRQRVGCDAFIFSQQTTQWGDFLQTMHVLHILWFFFFIPPRKRSDILLFVRFCSYRSFLILFSLEFLSNYFLFHFFHSPSFIERPFKSLKIQQGSFQSLRASLFIVDTQKIHWSEHMMDLGLHLFGPLEVNFQSISRRALDHEQRIYLLSLALKRVGDIMSNFVHIGKKLFQ